MGANDAAEMLEVAKQEVGRLERENAELTRRAERAETLNQITQQELRQAGTVKAERDAALAETRRTGRLLNMSTDEVHGLHAVIERVRAWNDAPPGDRQTLASILSTSGTEALEAVKAGAWDEGFTVGNAHNGRRDANPYRKTGEQING